MSRSSMTQCGHLIRVTVWTEHGTSSQTCRTTAEARGAIATMLNRKPMGRA